MGRRRSKRKLRKSELSASEKLVAKLHESISRLDPEDQGTAHGLIHLWLTREYLRPGQWAEVSKLVSKYKPKVEGPFYLYGIMADDKLKLGYSKDPASRLKNLQTAHAGEVKIVWTTGPIDDQQSARDNERKLHRFCGDHHIRGEWFDLDALQHIRSNFELCG